MYEIALLGVVARRAVGLRRREAQGRCPALTVVEHDASGAARAFEPVVAAVEAFAPGVEIVRPGADGADPAAVAHDGLSAARARGTDVVLVDTAGRLHTKHNLMAEMQKVARVCARVVPGGPHGELHVVPLRRRSEFVGDRGVRRGHRRAVTEIPVVGQAARQPASGAGERRVEGDLRGQERLGRDGLEVRFRVAVPVLRAAVRVTGDQVRRPGRGQFQPSPEPLGR